jgi:hypothetical protein
LAAPSSLDGGDAGDSGKPRLDGDASSSSDAGFAIAKLQSRLRDLQRELSFLEGSHLPDSIKAVQTHSLTSNINRTMQDISALLQQSQG